MTKPTRKPRRPRLPLPEKSLIFFQAMECQRDGYGPIDRCVVEIIAAEGIDIYIGSEGWLWLVALFDNLQFWLICEHADLSYGPRGARAALTAKNTRFLHAVGLIANAYECATGKKATEPHKKKMDWTAIFFALRKS